MNTISVLSHLTTFLTEGDVQALNVPQTIGSTHIPVEPQNGKYVFTRLGLSLFFSKYYLIFYSEFRVTFNPYYFLRVA